MKRIFLLLIPFIFALFSCSESSGDQSFTILAYNMYLLFDDVNDGDEYYPFTTGSGYNTEHYKKRIELYKSFFLSDEGEADIYILLEVESERVLTDLMSGKMAKKGYKYYGIIENDSPISVGFISRHQIDSVYVHSNDGPRDILEINLFVSGEMLSIFAVHARSRTSGGDEERKSTFEHLSFLMSAKAPAVAIAAGDFNEDPRIGPDFLNAAAGLDNVLKVTGNVSQLSSDVFYAASLDSSVFDMETYYYENSWYSFDNIILSSAAFDGYGLEHSASYVVFPLDGVDEEGIPISYSLSDGFGYSDHLAVKTVLEYY